MDPQAQIGVVTVVYAGTLDFTAACCLWVFDWFLTLEDEVKYGWRGRKSWAFWLFLANRYLPAPYIIWINMVMFGNIDDWFASCQKSRFYPYIYAASVPIPTQLAIALRVYAVTGKNKLLCSPLAVLVVVQALWGFLLLVHLTRWSRLPEELLEPFRLCVYDLWAPGAIGYNATLLTFDITAFSIIVFSVRRELPARSLGITTLWGVILRDATVYFSIVLLIQFFALLFLFTGPASLRYLPTVLNLIVVPILATRLMLSLKIAAVNPVASWSLGTFSFKTATVLGGDRNFRFASRTFGVSGETPDVPAGWDEGDLELVSSGFAVTG